MAGTKNIDTISREVLEGVFVRRVLTDVSQGIDKDQRRIMSEASFNTPEFFTGRKFDVTDGKLRYTHYGIHRFVDMRSRKLGDGHVIKKKSHSIHNRILFGFANEIIAQLQFGFTETVKKEIREGLRESYASLTR
jgi:hypothetical protein